MDLGLKNKIALVTGSSKGLGLATVKVLLEEGAKVVISSRSPENLEKVSASLGNIGEFITVPGDVTNQADCKNIVEETVAAFDALDILITNCGGPDPGKFENVTDEQWNQAIQKSFKSSLYLIQAALPYLKKSSSPSILTMTSFTVKQPLENLILSNSVRAATIGLTKSLSFEFGEYGIRVNSILPGWTLTERVDVLINNRSKVNNSSFDAEMEKITSSIPLSRMGEPAEFGRVAAFLVSPAASYVNGVMLNVDGGITKGLF